MTTTTKIRLITAANSLPRKVIQLMRLRMLLPTHGRKQHNSEIVSLCVSIFSRDPGPETEVTNEGMNYRLVNGRKAE